MKRFERIFKRWCSVTLQWTRGSIERLFGRVMRRDEIETVRAVMKTKVKEKRGRARSKNRWLIKNDI